jgi:hypothetical protein
MLNNLKVLGSIFSAIFGNKKVGLRYPLGDIAKHQNIIKFTAFARTQSNSSVKKISDSPQFKASILGSVCLYMPSGLQVNDNLSYDNADTGVGGMLVNSYQGSSSAGEFLGNVAKSAPQLGDRFISQKLAETSQSKGLAGGIAGQILINRGEVVNPHTQMLFRSPQLRQFNFTFKMMPRSEAEAKEIVNIVRFFRLAAYPSTGQGERSSEGGSLNMASYIFPDVFEIKYLTNNRPNTNMIKYARAYITAVNVTYNPTSPSFFANGMPSEIDLSLTFQETKALSREDIQKGY